MSSCEWFPMSQEQIRTWLIDHPDALPRTLNDLAQFPMAFRRVMVNAVKAEVRKDLWREHLETFLGSESPLNESQRRIVAATILKFPELFTAPAPNPALVEWEREIAITFSRQEAARVFAQIGPPEPPNGIPLPPDAIPAPAV